MDGDSPDDEIVPEKPRLKVGLKGCAVALAGAVLLGLLVAYLLRIWG